MSLSSEQISCYVRHLKLNDTIYLANAKLSNKANEYTAGTGLVLNGNEFAVDTAQILQYQDSSCSAIGEKSKTFGSNSIAYTDYSFVNGIYCTAGTNSFRIVKCDTTTKKIWLNSVTGLKIGYECSMRLLNNYDLFGSIKSIDTANKIVTFDKFPASFRVDECLSDIYISADLNYDNHGTFLSAHRSNSYTKPINEYQVNSDINSFWVLGKPNIGDLSTYAEAAHAEGYGCNATRQYSHAEGLYTTTIGKYAHAEGMETIAAYNAHAEGNSTSAFGGNSHAEGFGTLAKGMNSHSEGIFTQATGYGSHSDGLCAIVSSANSYAWNGIYSKYYDNGNGTFNINPANAVSGFYIGQQNLDQIINAYVQPAMNYIKDLVYGKMLDIITPILSGESKYITMNVGVLSGKFMNWTNGVFDTEPTYSVLSCAVEPGDKIYLNDLHCGWYAGVVCKNERGQRVFSWDPSDYIRRLSDGKTFYYGSKELPSDITREILDAATKDDEYHWLRTRITNTAKLDNSGNNVELTMPANACYIYISTQKLKYNDDGSIKPETMPIVQRMSKTICNVADISQILSNSSKLADEILK